MTWAYGSVTAPTQYSGTTTTGYVQITASAVNVAAIRFTLAEGGAASVVNLMAADNTTPVASDVPMTAGVSYVDHGMGLTWTGLAIKSSVAGVFYRIQVN